MLNSKRGLDGQSDGYKHIGCSGPRWIVGAPLGKRQRTINKDMAPTENITGEYADLAVRDLMCRASVRETDTAQYLALLQKSGPIDDQKRKVCRTILNKVITHNIERGSRVLPSTARNCLLPLRNAARSPPQGASNLPCGDRRPIIRREEGSSSRRHAPM